MRVSVNGEPRDLPEELTLAGLLEELKIDRRRVAVALNSSLVARRDLATVMLSADDRVEIVQAVGGG